MLCLPGPENWEAIDTGDLRINGTTLHVQQEGGQGRGTGWTIWDGAVVLARHLEAARSEYADVAACLELGAGTGLAGLGAAAALQVPVVLTDIPDVLPALSSNVRAHSSLAAQVRTEPLDWTSAQLDLSVECALRGAPGRHTAAGGGTAALGDAARLQQEPRSQADAWQARQACSAAAHQVGSGDAEAGPSHGNGGDCVIAGTRDANRSSGAAPGPLLVLAADCVWLPELVQPLIQTLTAICRHVRTGGACADRHSDVRVLLAYKSRSKRVDDMLFRGLAEARFSVEAVPARPCEQLGSIQLWLARPKVS